MTRAPERSDFEAQKSAMLLGLARRAIERALDDRGTAALAENSVGLAWLPGLPWLEEPGATFVTLKLDGRLRGCIGSLEAKRPLREDVIDNARAAAFEDPRFPALTAGEFEGLTVEVSVLSKPEPIECASEAELLAELRPGVDGLVLEYGHHRATYLPQVWESLQEPSVFLSGLRQKARLDADFWSSEIRFARYTVEKHTER